MTLKIHNPATGKQITEMETDDVSSISLKFKKAQAAQKEWQKTSPSHRASIIAKFRDGLKTQLQSCAEIQSAETGKPISQARGEVSTTLDRIDYFINQFDSRIGEKVVHTEAGLEEKIVMEPLGVVVNISAWNYPYFVGTNAFIPALLTGNAVMYKPSEFATMTGAAIVSIMQDAGLPPDLMPLICGDGSVGSALLDLPIDGIFFTGSYPTGVKIATKAAAKMIKVGLELGGKDPIYVRSDMDPVTSAQGIADGCFYNAGQSCCAVERLYVHEDIYEKFVTSLADFAKAAKVGNPMDESTYIGPLTRAEQIGVLENQIEDAVKKGGTVIAGGKRHELGQSYFQPTVIRDADHDMLLMRDESFGPIIGVMAVNGDDEALALMNDTDFGLTAGVYTKDRAKAEYFMSNLNAGSVYWNCCDRVSANLPWSGRNQSGIGSTMSAIGIDAFLKPKAWHLRNP